MNRLWVRLSLVIVFVVVIITISPVVWRTWIEPQDRPKPIPREIDSEMAAAFEEEMESRIWRSVSSTLLVGGFLALGAGVIVSRWLVAPLGKLEAGALAVSEHQLDYRVPVQGSKEIQSVARAFNQMADSLEVQETLRQNLLADVTHELRHPVHILQGIFGLFWMAYIPWTERRLPVSWSRRTC